MTDSDDPVVREILAESGQRGGASGVTFHQRPNAAGRYPTAAILTAVRLLAEDAEAHGLPMAAGLRGMLEQVDPDLPVEIEFSGAGPLDCIAERRDQHGFWWRYEHAEDEPRDTLLSAIMIAGNVAAQEARSSGKSYVVARAATGADAIYVFAGDHPDARSAGINVMFGFTPDGDRIRRPATPTATRH
jgi:hypothetical protein